MQLLTIWTHTFKFCWDVIGKHGINLRYVWFDVSTHCVKITTKWLVNTPITSATFVCVLRTDLLSLSNFQEYQELTAVPCVTLHVTDLSLWSHPSALSNPCPLSFPRGTHTLSANVICMLRAVFCNSTKKWWKCQYLAERPGFYQTIVIQRSLFF